MSKYDGLMRHLEGQQDDVITLPFKKIDKLIAGGLPQSAYDYRPWWANRHDGRGAQNIAWQSAGWETCDVDMTEEVVTFKKVRKNQNVELTGVKNPLTIAEAKAGLAAALGISKDNIEIIIKV